MDGDSPSIRPFLTCPDPKKAPSPPPSPAPPHFLAAFTHNPAAHPHPAWGLPLPSGARPDPATPERPGREGGGAKFRPRHPRAAPPGTPMPSPHLTELRQGGWKLLFVSTAAGPNCCISTAARKRLRSLGQKRAEPPLLSVPAGEWRQPAFSRDFSHPLCPPSSTPLALC